MKQHETKFRTWHSLNKQMDYFELFDLTVPNGIGYLGEVVNGHFVTGTTMQIAEINEPLKRVVYEGDILEAYRRDDNMKEKPVRSEVTFLNGCFMAFNCTWHELYRLWQSDFKVIGNIYQNPQLLKK